MSPESTKPVIQTLGPCRFPSPLPMSLRPDDNIPDFYSDSRPVHYFEPLPSGQQSDREILFEQAGPRKSLYFDPAATRAAIVTCGGLCPGLNNVIRSLVMELHFGYGVREILGLRYGYRGLSPDYGCEPVRLTPEKVDLIHEVGGTVLGSSRGQQDLGVMADFLASREIDILFTVGGDGTLRGAHALHQELERRGQKRAVVGVPKTIDNDILFCQPSFGFSTAVSIANEIVRLAHVEAQGAPRGIGLVKLMGRDSGFIALGATVTSQMVNFVLVPEVPFTLGGENGLLALLDRRMAAKDHAVIVVAEGAGQDLFEAGGGGRDASGNVRYHDIGVFLKETISDHFKGNGEPVEIKYIDPSYIVRGAPANGQDSYLCDQMARSAAHAAMAGKTDLFVGSLGGCFVHVPIPLGTSDKQRVHPEGRQWAAALAATGQPALMR